MNSRNRRPAWQVGAFLVFALGGVLAGSIYLKHRFGAGDATGPRTEAAAVYARPRPMPAFSLSDDEGRPAANTVFIGRWSLLFFGYTHCPDACPATLAELVLVVRQLADLPVGLRPQVWLVSVDPARDTSAVLHEYVRFFDPGFRGLTGEPAALEDFTRRLGVAVVVRHEAGGDYSVDHTAAILLVNPAGEIAGVFPAPHEVRTLAADYRAIVTYGLTGAAHG